MELAKEKSKHKKVTLMFEYYDHQMHKGIVKYAKQSGWIITNPGIHHNHFFDSGGDIDGILSFHSDKDKIVKLIKKAAVPTVDLGWKNEKIKLPQVLPDNEAIGRMAAEYFISKGFSNFIDIGPPSHFPIQKKRLKGFTSVIAKSDHKVIKFEFRQLEEHLPSLPKQTAIVCVGDVAAYKTLMLLRDKGYAVPDDFAVLGIDNDEYICDIATPPLSSIDINLERIAFDACALLDSIMNGAEVPKKPVLIPPLRVVERHSTNILAVEHPNVARALSFIVKNYPKSITIEDIVTASGICRRQLDITFKKKVGQTLFGCLVNYRLKDAKRLLLHTNLTLDVIADKCGFTSQRHFIKTLKREEDITPTEFRKEQMRLN